MRAIDIYEVRQADGTRYLAMSRVDYLRVLDDPTLVDAGGVSLGHIDVAHDRTMDLSGAVDPSVREALLDHIREGTCERERDRELGELLLIEYMPRYVRDSHDAAGNAGAYPHNGSCRYVVEGPVDEDDHLRAIRHATEDDVDSYERIYDLSTLD